MSGFMDGVTPQGISEAQNGYAKFDIGENPCFIENVKETTAKSGRPMLEVTFRKDNTAEIRHYIVDNEWKLANLKSLMEAFAIPFNCFDYALWIHRRGIVVTREGEYNGNTRPEVWYLKAGGSGKPSSGSSHKPPQKARQADDHFDDDIPF